ncbi:MAG: hypothetical protein H6706_04205 [Myxococcales bacterium]|nr:hypothetical protein [Myxococcales bacterium]
MSRRLLLCAFLLPLAACGDKGGDPAAAPKPAGKSAADIVKELQAGALGEVMAARPAGATLEFEVKSIDDDSVVAVVPKGWEESKGIPGRFKAPANSDFGFMTSFSVGTNCDGMCSPKDWKAVAEKVDLAQFRDASKFAIVSEKDLTNPTGKLLQATTTGGGFGGPKTHLTLVRWKEGASRYQTCRASLEGEAANAMLPAFIKACETSVVLDLQ